MVRIARETRETSNDGGSPPAVMAEGDEYSGGSGAESSSSSSSSPSPSPSPSSAAPTQQHSYEPVFSAAYYADYSSIPEPCTVEEVLDVNANSSSPPQRRRANELSIRRRGGAPDLGEDDSGPRRGPGNQVTFPTRLHDILSRPDLKGVVEWLPHGRSWRILDQAEFVNRVMPHYFTQSKFASFMRQVNGWGFVRVTRGDEVNSYYSEFFLRAKRSLTRFMERRPAMRDTLGPEPNFAKYSPLPPNPEVDPASLVPLTPIPPSKAALKVKSSKRARRPRNAPEQRPLAPAVDKEEVEEEEVPNEAAKPAASPQPALAPELSFQQAMLQTQLVQLQRLQQWQQQQQAPQNVLPQQMAPHGQLVQQQQAAFSSMPQAFPQEMPMQVPSGMLPQIMPGSQGSMAPQGFKGMPPQQQFKFEGNGAPSMGSPIRQPSQAVPQGVGSANAAMLMQQQHGGDAATMSATPLGGFKMPQNPLELAALMPSGQMNISQQPMMKSPYPQAEQAPTQATHYQWVDPTPLREDRAPRVSPLAPSSQGAAAKALTTFAAMSAPLEADPFASDDDDVPMSDVDMDDADVAGVVSMLAKSGGGGGDSSFGCLRGGDDGFLGSSLDDIW